MKLTGIALACILTCLNALTISAQIITSSPAMIQRSSSGIVITYHADQGNRGLADLPTSDAVYAHTGLITGESLSDSDWKNAPTWGDNSAKYKMTRTATNTYTLTIPSIDSYYGVAATVDVKKLCFVFRNTNSSREGKTESGGDIYATVYADGVFDMELVTSTSAVVFTSPTSVECTANTTMDADIKITLKTPNANTVVANKTNTSTLSTVISIADPGTTEVIAEATYNGKTLTRTYSAYLASGTTARNYPGGVPKMGPVDNGDGTVTFCLGAPGKQSVFIIGSWNDYKVVDSQNMYYQDYQGNRYFWTTISGIENGKNYPYYFIVDGEKTVGDPYARLVLDPWNDRYIPSTTYPDIPEYPSTVSGVPVAVYNTALDGKNYNWNVKNFKGVDQSQLIIYELLIRDFTGTEGQANGEGTIAGVMEHLDYIKSLGVNAVELLPIMEFNDNNSWGYNTNFYFAPDKFYGTPDDYRRLIDAIHERGMAVILDIVFNQSDGLHPWYQMYDIANNPFYNGSAPHAYSVLNDWNQDNAMVQQQWHDALRYWIEAYNIDGYRFDLVKGLGSNSSYNATYNETTNTFTGVTDAKTNAYNASRVARMKELHDAMRQVKPDAYFINENLATAQEENEMSLDGEINWANINGDACNFAKGQQAALSRFYAPLDQNRNWGTTVSYAESHDEERMAYAVSTSGVSGVKGNIVNTMRRLGCVAAVMLMSPGAHMIWQFQEMGADQTTKNSSGNDTSPKRVIWSYLDNANRAGLVQSYRELNAIRRANPQLFTDQATATINCATVNWGTGYTIKLTNGASELFLAVNPGTTGSARVNAPLTYAQTDYQLLSHSYDTTPTIANKRITLAAGTYAIYATKDISSSIDEIATDPDAVRVYSNAGRLIIDGDYNHADVYTTDGRNVGRTEDLPSGLYIVVVDGHAYKTTVR